MENNTSAMEVVAKSIKKSSCSCRQGEPVESASWQPTQTKNKRRCRRLDMDKAAT